LNWMQLLAQLFRAQSGGRESRQSAHSTNAPGGAMSNSGQTPEAQRLLMQLLQSYLNPGAGRMGNDTVGGGDVFGGFERGGKPVGNIGWLSGNSPQPYHASQIGQSMQPSWGAQNWLSQFFNDVNKGQGSNPYGAAGGQGGLSGLLGDTPGGQYHGGGQGMMDFLSRGQGLEGMDEAFRGGQGGGMGGNGYSTNLYF
jgi:hypothetical protein